MSPRPLGPTLGRIIARELDRTAAQVRAYPDDASLWRGGGTVKNAPGTLALHIAGNLEHYIGAVLGGTGYVRDRPAEFGDRDVTRTEIIRRLEAARASVTATLAELSDEELAAPYPGEAPAHLDGPSSAEFVIHLIWHLGWHLGQIDYHRRLTEGGEAV